MKDVHLIAEMARRTFFVSEDDGVLRYAIDAGRWGTFKANSPAGTAHSRGYILVRFGGVGALAHRVVWLMEHGKWPDGEIDHIDGDKRNNRLSNLRDVSHSVNQQNRRSPQRNSAIKMLGVIKQGRSFHATLRLNGKSHFIGAFSTPEQAHQAYVAAKRQLHEGCTI